MNEFRRRWGERNPQKIADAANAPKKVEASERLPVTMPDGVLFISYAREDQPAVERLRASLKDFPVWLDQPKLEAGDGWEHKIEDNIARCRFFMPIISSTTDKRLEGFFRREWNQAADRTRAMHEDFRFIVPIAIDDTKRQRRVSRNLFSARIGGSFPMEKRRRSFRMEIRALFESQSTNGD